MSQQTEHRTTDVVVIGGGPTGENLAARVVAKGLQAVLVEAELVGGECSFWACMPSKALLRPGAALAAARRVPGAAEAVTGRLDVGRVLQRRDELAEHWDDADQVKWAEGAGVTLERGHGRLVAERTVEVTAGGGDLVTWTARHAVVLATGSEPVTPDITGLAGVPHWGSREATSARQVPDRLAVIGGGVIAVEMAQAYARLGSTVTVVTASPLLSRAETRAGELVAEALRADGVELRAATRCTTVARDGEDGEVTLTLDQGRQVVADELLVATGRRPRTGDVGLESVGLDGDEPLDVDGTGLVGGVPGRWLYAAGDVTGAAPLTHMGKYAARIVGSAVAARAAGHDAAEGDWAPHRTTALHRAVTQVVFTDPEVTSVGLTAQQAQDAGISTRVVDLDLAVAGSAVHADGYTGWARMVVDTDREVLVGVTFVGQDVAELLHSATVAVVGEVPLSRLWHAVPSFPTISEIWLRLLEEYGL